MFQQFLRLSKWLRVFIVLDVVLVVLLLAMWFWMTVASGPVFPTDANKPKQEVAEPAKPAPAPPTAADSSRLSGSPSPSAGNASGPAPANVLQGSPTDQFIMPSGNIACSLTDKAICVVYETDAAITNADNCPGGVLGHAFQLESDGKVTQLCTGKSPVKPASGIATLAYGEERTVGPYTCASTRDGVTCKSTQNGHGFTLSRGGLDTF